MGLTAALFILLIAIQHYMPKPIDWSVTYNATSKSPYGCYVLNELNETIFPQQKMSNNEASFFVSLDSSSTETKNIIVITSDFDPDPYDLKALLRFVSNGNNLFISSDNMGHAFLDTLDLKLNTSLIDTSVFKPGEEILYLHNSSLKNDSGFHFQRRMPQVSFSAFDSMHTVRLGSNEKGAANFICTRLGMGKIYLHTQPLVFTNYHLLYGNVEYASAALSYLPIRQTIWDNYYKPGRILNTSPVRYILSQAPLRNAYYLLLLTLLLYMVLESKRRQRIIPVIQPKENQSLKFIKTIGSLYFKQHNNSDLAKKKIIFFKEFLRERYYITQLSTSNESIKQIAAKSGISNKQIKKLMESAHYYENAREVTDGGLIELNRRIELFYEQCL
ncbi:MAG: DUF4350 domain-containing protein [Prolixibacteraceae bacterium]